MKNLSIIVAATALIAFSLGYFARSVVERTPNVASGPEELALREHTESPATQAQTIVESDQNDADVSFIPSSNHEVVITSERSRSREHFMRIRLGDFFLINGIGSERKEQIIHGLMDADYYIALKRKAMIDRHVAEKAEPITQEDVDRITLTAEEEAELYAERESLSRQILDEYFAAYQEYDRTSLQQRVVGAFSSSLQEPLELAARESMVQIMYEEALRLESERKSESAGPGSDDPNTPQGWEADKEKHYDELLARRSRNERVMDRTKAYLTASQFEQFKRLLDNDLRRYELLIELTDIDEAD